MTEQELWARAEAKYGQQIVNVEWRETNGQDRREIITLRGGGKVVVNYSRMTITEY